MGFMEEVDFGGALVGGDGARPNLMCQRIGIGGNKQATIRTPCTHLGCFGFLLDLMVLGDLLLLFVFCIFRILSDSLEFIGIL